MKSYSMSITEVCSQGFNQHYNVRVASGNGFAPKRRHALLESTMTHLLRRRLEV